MSLKDPALKMSKSHQDPRSRILLTDTHKDIASKVKLAVTDSLPLISYDPQTRPGISNLIEIIHHVEGGRTSCEDLAREFESLSKQNFKVLVSDRISSSLLQVRENFHRILNADAGRYLDAVAAQGAVKAKASAEETMALVREVVGL